MKKTIFSLLFLTTTSFVASAQTDVNINVVNLLFFEASGSVEKGINKNFSIGGFAGYHYGLPNADDSDVSPFSSNNWGENKFFHIGPEMKFYVYPKGKLDRFFVSTYLRYSGGKATSPDSDYNTGQPVSSSYNKLAMGFSIGGKWVTKSNFIFGIFGGLDRNFVSIYENQEYLDYTLGGNDDEYFGYRIGAHIGYRFDN